MFPNLQIFKHSSLADDGKEKAIIPRDSYSQQLDFWQVSRPCLITLYANNHYELSEHSQKSHCEEYYKPSFKLANKKRFIPPSSTA